MSLGVSSGIVTQVSGPLTKETTYVNALPVNIYGSGIFGPASTFSRADGNISLNVNISGGILQASLSGSTITTAPFSPQSGQYVMLSGGFAGISGLPVSTTVTVNPVAYQSGTEVGISGGQAALSGLFVVISGGVATSIP